MKNIVNSALCGEFKKILLLILLIAITGCSNGTTKPEASGIIKGTVTYQQTDMPVKDAVIYTSPSTKTTTTDSLGDFLITDIQAGTYFVFAQKECNGK